MGNGEGPGGERFPEVHPAVKVGNRDASRSAEEMDVIRHDHVASDKPIAGIAPRGEEAIHGVGIVEDALAVFRVDRDEEEDGTVSEYIYFDLTGEVPKVRIDLTTGEEELIRFE